MQCVRDEPTRETNVKTRSKRIAGLAAVGVLVGGFDAWAAADYPVEPKE